MNQHHSAIHYQPSLSTAFHLLIIRNQPVNIFKYVNFGMYLINHIGIIAHHIRHNIFKILIGKAFHLGRIFAIIIYQFFITAAPAAYRDGYAAANAPSEAASANPG